MTKRESKYRYIEKKVRCRGLGLWEQREMEKDRNPAPFDDPVQTVKWIILFATRGRIIKRRHGALHGILLLSSDPSSEEKGEKIDSELFNSHN